MTTKEVQDLEADALQAHHRGDRWEAFWKVAGPRLSAIHPHDRRAWHRQMRRLLSIVVSGDVANVDPLTCLWGEAWDVDDLEGDL